MPQEFSALERARNALVNFDLLGTQAKKMLRLLHFGDAGSSNASRDRYEAVEAASELLDVGLARLTWISVDLLPYTEPGENGLRESGSLRRTSPVDVAERYTSAARDVLVNLAIITNSDLWPAIAPLQKSVKSWSAAPGFACGALAGALTCVRASRRCTVARPTGATQTSSFPTTAAQGLD